jgi:hypothetical protein
MGELTRPSGLVRPCGLFGMVSSSGLGGLARPTGLGWIVSLVAWAV